MVRAFLRCEIFLSVFAFALPAAAQGASASGSASADASTSTASVDTAKKPGAFVIGAEVGAIFPQPFSALGTHAAVGIELGYRLPFIGQRLEIMLGAGYAPPGNSTTIKRTEGDYTAEVSSQQLHFSLGPRFRVMDGTSPWNVTIAAGPRLYFLESNSNGSRGGNAMMEFREQSAEFGAFAAIGGEYRLGPGAIFLDVDFGYASLKRHRIMGDANTGNLTTTLGYRFFL